MKKYKFTLVLLFLFIIKINSQTHPTFTTEPVELISSSLEASCTSFKDINNIYDKFLGDWVYNENDHYFKVTFYKGTNRPLFGYDRCSEEYLYTRCVYKYNNEIIFDSYNTNTCYIDSIYPLNANSILFNYSEPTNPSICLNKLSSIVTINYSLNPSNQPILTWNRENLIVNERIPCSDGTYSNTYQQYNVPVNIILIKQ